MKPIKSSEHREIFDIEIQNGKKIKYWIENWDTWKFLGYSDNVEAECDIISFEELRDDYGVGATKVVKTVTKIEEGKKPREIFYPDEQPVPPMTIRKISVLGTCLPGSEQMMKDLQFTHAYGNRYDWPNYDEVERLGMKVFVNIRGDVEELTEEIIRQRVNQWKDRPGCGGFWCDQLGHEPDITNPPMNRRIWFYETVRKYDPDIVNHPCMEMFDLTATGDFPPEKHQGWQKAYDEKTLDLLLFDCYVSDPSDEKMRKDITRFHNKFTGKYVKTRQVIPQLNAFNYRPGSIRIAYEIWKELLGDEMGIAYYKDTEIRKNEPMQQEIKKINSEIGRR